MIDKKTLDLLPGIWCVVDRYSRYTYYNNAYAKLVGVYDKPKDFLIGKTVANMNCPAAQCAPIFWKEDELVITTQKKVKVLNYLQMANDTWTVLQINKQPVFNDDGTISSIIFEILDQSANHVLNLALTLGKQSYEEIDNNGVLLQLNKRNLEIKLGKKESECLFFLCNGYSYKEIANLREISYRTVVDHVERLKTKFNASSTNELIERALLHNKLGAIPQKYFQQQTSIILDIES